MRAIRCVRMELGEPDASGRRRPVAIPGSEFDDPLRRGDRGHRHAGQPAADRRPRPDLKLNKWGYIIVDANGMTSKPGVFAGGDIVRGAATVILAMGDGKKAAGAIDRYLARKRQQTA